MDKMQSVKEIRNYMELSQSQFGNYFGIPLRTVQNWESENGSNPPSYVVDMIRRVVDLEEEVTANEMKGMVPRTRVNKTNRLDGLTLMATIGDASISACFLDPQYRTILDELSYGNEGERQKARCELPQMGDDTISRFIDEINRVLKPSAHLFLWIDKLILCEGKVKDWIQDTELNLVDMITWDKGRMGMGYRSRSQSEFLIILQKSPIRAKDCWRDHAIADVWRERVPKNHPHSKPIELQKRLLVATTEEGDYVLDPASGGYSVFEACQSLNREFIGCDIEFGDG